MNERALKILSKINMEVVKRLNSSLMIKQAPRSPLSDIFSSALEGKSLKRKDSPVDLAAKGSREAHSALVDQISICITKELRINQAMVDEVLEGYYFNYFGKPEDLTSTDSEILLDFIGRILISKDADPDDKIRKISQVIYQECFGYGCLDEFRYLGMDKATYHKVEEIFCFGPNTLALKISGIDFKLDKLYYPEDQINRVVNKLSRSSDVGLSKANPKVETELMDQSRVTLNKAPLTKFSTFNIRLHYSGGLGTKDFIKLRSTSAEAERFLDLIMKFKPRFAFFGGQGVGKTTQIVNLCRRYPANTTIVTGESAFELALENIQHLIVNPMRLGILSTEEFLKALFRFNAKMLLMGEARDAEDCILITQAAQRTEFGTVFSWHTGDVMEGIYGIANSLVRAGAFRTLFEAVKEVCNSLDYAVVPRVADASTGYEGRRHIYQIIEVGKIHHEGEIPKLRTLFEYDYKLGELVNTHEGISEEMAEILGKRQPLNENYLKILRSGNYLFN